MKERFVNGNAPVSLVTGACGFLGSHLADRLLDEGHLVIGVDNLSTGRIENLNEKFLKSRQLIFIKADITEEFDLPELNYSHIWHLASPASPVEYQRLSIETMLVNSIGSKKMLDIALSHGAQCLLASTSEVYGDPRVFPQPESYWGNTNSFGERACYDESKRFAEALFYEYIHRYGADARVVRLFNIYGPRMQINDGRVVPNFICQALRGEPVKVHGSGMQTRSFTYVDDGVEGIIRAMFCGNTRGEVINIGNPAEHTILELAGLVTRLCQAKLEIIYDKPRPDDPSRRCPDIGKARSILGWEPLTTLEQGLAKTIEFYLDKV